MKKSLALLMLLLFISMVNVAFAAPTFQTISDPIYEFGTVNQGDKVRKTFEFRNSGDDTLFILNVKGS